MIGARKALVCAALTCHAMAADAASCSASAVSLAFGNYSAFNPLHSEITTNVTVTCSGAVGEVVAYTIALSAGGGTFGTRRMRSPAGRQLAYNLFTTAARSTVWGDGSTGTSLRADGYTLSAPSTTRSYTVYGRVFAGQKVPVGTYSDSIVVTLSF